MWKMLQQDSPDDFVIATGTDLSVRDFVELSFAQVGLDWQEYVKFDHRYLRPTEVEALVGDASKAERELNWKASVNPSELAAIMVDHDIAAIEGHIADKPRGSVWLEAIQ
jgi:GDPmannose 4,6-dehydratase